MCSSQIDAIHVVSSRDAIYIPAVNAAMDNSSAKLFVTQVAENNICFVIRLYASGTITLNKDYVALIGFTANV